MSQHTVQSNAEDRSEPGTAIRSQQECFEAVSAGVVEHLSSLRAFAR